jgi:hypothetical protein
MKPARLFFVIGAARSGTTSLYKVLSRHPDIFVPRVKEPRFFKENWDKGWHWYAGLYREAPAGAAAGDFSPSYSIAAGRNYVADRIARAYPEARILYMVRNPIDCAISNWRMTAEMTGRHRSFGAALADPRWSVTVLRRTLFFRQVSEYRRVFPDAQILVVPLEAMRHDPQRWLAAVQRHIGVEERYLGTFPKSNASSRKSGRPGIPVIPTVDRQRFLDLVTEDARAMLAYLDLPDDFWKLSTRYSGWTSRRTPPAPPALPVLKQWARSGLRLLRPSGLQGRPGEPPDGFNA